VGYYRAQRGDCLSSIALEYGFADYQIIYQRPENADFRQKRPNPNIICPGDVLFIPDLEIKEVSKATGQRHVFELKKPRVHLRLCLKDDLHQPYESTKYHLRVGDKEWDGSTDHAGMVEQDIEPDATKGEITVFPMGGHKPDEGYTFSLQLGDLDPIDEMSGVDARLINLGFGPADTEETLSDDDRVSALKAFQGKFHLDITGELTVETRSKLRELHDGE
jgi:hypothetical protein